MEDYEKLYKQSQLQIKKQKEQIRKLQEQIRERCQSYLIHSSRYRSRRGSDEKSNQKSQASNIMYESSLKSQDDFKQNAIQSNVVGVVLDFHTQKPNGIDEQTETIEVVQEDQRYNKANALNSRIPIQQFVEKEPQSSQNSNPVKENTSKEQQQIALENHNNNFWESVVGGLNQRIAMMQKQKTEQAQKILDLEQEIKLYKNEQKQWTESAMKKKQTKPIEFSSAQKQETENVNQFSTTQELISKLFKKFQGKIDFNSCSNLQQKINRLASYVEQLNQKEKDRENYMQQENSLKQSLVSDYNFNSPYRKIKNTISKDIQMRDTYNENEIQLLRKKCQQLQMELTVSRNEKRRSPFQKQQIQGTDNFVEQQEIINQPPYLIEEELEKPNNPFVKRSFVRKKVVKRNLSAMILRTPSKTKQESKTSMINQLEKLKNHLEKSKDGNNEKQILSLSKKINKLEHNIAEKQQKIDEVSDDGSSIARASGISQDNFTEIIQVETEGPGFRNYTAHILGLNKKDNSEKKKKDKIYA